MSALSIVFLALTTSTSAVWENLQVVFGGSSSHQPDFADHPDIFEVPTQLRAIFPAKNFNRDVTTTWWQTAILDGHEIEASKGVADALKASTFVVLDKEFYKASTCG